MLDAATVLARQSGIPPENVLLVDRHETYSHNDPNSAYPENEFVDRLEAFLQTVRTSVGWCGVKTPGGTRRSERR